MLPQRPIWFRQFNCFWKINRFWILAILSLCLACLVSGNPVIARSSQDGMVAQMSDRPTTHQLLQQGRSLYQAGKFAAAAAVWERTLQISASQPDRLEQAKVSNYLALAYQQLGQRERAAGAIANCLRLLQGATSPTAQLLLAQALNHQGSLQLAQGDAEAALASWKQAETSYTGAGNEAGRIGSLINQAQAQQALGFYLQARQTLAGVEQALRQQTDRQLQVTGWRSLGNVLRLIGELDNSRQVLERGLAIARQQPAGDLAELAAILLSLGNTLQALQEVKTATDFYQQAVAVSPAPLIRVQAQLNYFNLLVETGQWSAAQALLPTLPLQLTDLPPGRATVYAHIHLAQSWLKLHQSHPAKSSASSLPVAQLLATAAQQAQQIGDQQAASYALGYLGSVYEQTGQMNQAKTLTQRAIILAQSSNAPDTYLWQWQLGRILKVEGTLPAAIAAYEVALTTLKSLRSDLVAINPDIQFSFREGVEPVYREYVDLLLKGNPSPGRLQQARVVIESLQLAELDNFFRTACLEGQIVPLEQVDQTSAAVIYPIILRDRMAVILSLPHQPLRYYATNVAQAEVETVLRQLRQNLEKPYTSPEGRKFAQQTYDWLIRPIAGDLSQSGVQTLVFVLDGSLRNVPMAALYDGKQYLLEQYSIALTPGLQLLGPKPLRQGPLTTLALGLTESRHGFSALPNVENELQAIQAKLPSQVLLNQAFTSTELERQIDSQPFSIVHLATHGQFSSNVAETFVLAWDKPIPVNELKTLLQTRDLKQAEAIELLVLSACQTATGDDRAALGLAGVAVEAGARSTLASLWSLDDESGARLISEFYRVLATRQVTKAEALRQAQLTLLRDPDYRYPIHWAPYVLLGNWL